eukprot:TRINITY_DN1844_c1_g1_i2.p1 TRINITY_DN1844_c1_g1~~TRINITY_DN1844_c1_g1_i2.p1  ORF type:complete len:312 (+),score=81.61 TRINITY_DN1844_c1_g1_i2:231-1166(+)
MKDPSIKMISCGYYHTMIYKESGELFVFGSNEYGQLGIGTLKNQKQPTPLLLMKDETIKMIRLGGNHSIIYKENGDLLVFGKNYYGQLGLGDDTTEILTPTLLLNDLDIEDIICGANHTMYHKKNGEIYFFGYGDGEQLGITNGLKEIRTPTLLTKIEDIILISTSYDHNFILKKDGELVGFGINEELKISHKFPKDKVLLPQTIMKDENIQSVVCTTSGTLIHYNDGKIFARGCFISKVYLNEMIFNKPSIMFVGSGDIEPWSPRTHEHFPIEIKQSILQFVLVLKYFQKKFGFKITKYLLHSIIELSLI